MPDTDIDAKSLSTAERPGSAKADVASPEPCPAQVVAIGPPSTLVQRLTRTPCSEPALRAPLSAVKRLILTAAASASQRRKRFVRSILKRRAGKRVANAVMRRYIGIVPRPVRTQQQTSLDAAAKECREEAAILRRLLVLYRPRASEVEPSHPATSPIAAVEFLNTAAACAQEARRAQERGTQRGAGFYVYDETAAASAAVPTAADAAKS